MEFPTSMLGSLNTNYAVSNIRARTVWGLDTLNYTELSLRFLVLCGYSNRSLIGGQILTLTYPLVGNYGVPDTSIKDADGVHTNSESGRIQARALVVHELSSTASHWNMSMTLDEWMHTQKIPGISGIDQEP